MVPRRPAARKMTDSDLPLLVVVTGPPAAGKTTIATALAAEIGLPLIAKDPLKETLHDSLGGEGREWSRQLGVATFELVFHVLDELLRNRCSVVTEGNFGRAEPFRALPPARILQLHVSARREIIRERFTTRPARHAVHYDAETVNELTDETHAGQWTPLALEGELIEIDTTTFPDVAELTARLAKRLMMRRSGRPAEPGFPRREPR